LDVTQKTVIASGNLRVFFNKIYGKFLETSKIFARILWLGVGMGEGVAALKKIKTLVYNFVQKIQFQKKIMMNQMLVF
jgi:hypothetical protein